MNHEIWKDIIELDNQYQISNLGRIRSRKNSSRKKLKLIDEEYYFLKSHPDKDGYLKVCISFNGAKNFIVHRLVALYFVPNEFNKKEVNHLNGIKTDNRSCNLQWCTRSENQIHAIKNNLQPVCKGSQRGKCAKLREDLVKEIKIRLSNGEKYNKINKDYGVSNTTIYDIFKNKTWTHVK